MTSHAINKNSEAIRPFVPPRFFRNPHLQTIVGGKYLRTTDGVTFTRRRLSTPDDDFIDIDFAHAGGIVWSQFAASAPIVLVLHGLTGSAKSAENIELYRQLTAVGMRSLGINYRSCSGEINKQPISYHAGSFEDVQLVLDWLTHRYPHTPIGVVGISFGGVILCNLLGRARPHEVKAAVAISIPFDLVAGFTALSKSFYNRVFLPKLKAAMQGKAHQVSHLIDLERAMAAPTVYQFDHLATAPLHGFESAEDYYTQCSPTQYLPHITTPTLFIRAIDDPLLTPDDIPYEVLAQNPNITAAITEWGGHVGFLENLRPRRWWAQRQAAHYLQHHLIEEAS